MLGTGLMVDWKNLVKVWNLDKVECVLFVKRQLKKSKSHEKECRLVSGEE